MTRKQLLIALAKWQTLLGLDQWKIKLKLVSKSDRYGDIEWRNDLKTATITISKQYKAQEATLVHELIHLALAGLQPCETPAKEAAMEWGVRKLERAFAVLAGIEYGDGAK